MTLTVSGPFLGQSWLFDRYKNMDNLPIIFIGVFIGFLVGFFVGGELINHEFKIGAIRHHAAHYDTNTGNFTWNHEAE